MAAEATPFDPYSSPSLPEGPYVPPSTSGRPGWLTALCVLCIVLGVLGLLNGILGVVGTIFAEPLQAMFSPAGTASGLPPEMRKVQDDFRAETLAVQKKFYIGSLVASVVRLAVAAMLLFGGIQCLNLKEVGRQWLLLACGAAVAFELCHMVLQTFVNLEMMTAVNGFVESFVQTMPQGDGLTQELVISVMRGTQIAGFVFQYLIAILKIAFYAWGALFLQRQKIRALFVSSPGAPPAALA